MKSITAYREKTRADDANRKLRSFAKRIKNFADEFQNVDLPEYTNWFVCLKENKTVPCGFDFVGIFSPDTDEGNEPEWDLIIPIPVLKKINEFMGW